MKSLLALILVASLSGASSVSFSSQGPDAMKALVGRQLKGVQITEATVCTSGPETVPAALIYQSAARAGIAPLNPIVAKALLQRTASMNWRTFLINGITDGTILVPLAAQSGVINIANKWVAALISGHVFFDNLASQATKRLPDPTPLLTVLLDTNTSLSFGSADCRDTVILTGPTKTAVVGPVPIQ